MQTNTVALIRAQGYRGQFYRPAVDNEIIILTILPYFKLHIYYLYYI